MSVPEVEIRLPRREAIVVALSFGMLVLAGLHILIQTSRSWDYNAIRLQRSFVLAAGESIYPARDSGPILNAIYGPVGAVAYLPATLMRSPASAVLLGQGLSILFLFLPVALLLRGAFRSTNLGDRGLKISTIRVSVCGSVRWIIYRREGDAPGTSK